jgi:hypothetical protein
VSLEITKKASGLKKDLEIHILKDIGTSSVKRDKSILHGIIINYVLKN